MSAASSVVAERMTIASKSPMIDARSDSESSTTSKRSSQKLEAGVGDRLANEDAGLAQTRAASWYASSARAAATPGSIAAPRSTRSVSTAVSAVVMSSTS